MKKIYFVIIGLLSFFLFPKDTNAVVLYPTNYGIYNPSGYADATSSMKGFYYSGHDYYGSTFASSSDRNGINYKYYPKNSMEHGRHYTLQFTLYSHSVSTYTTPFVVSVRNSDNTVSSCRIQTNYDSSYKLPDGGFTGISTVFCEDFYYLKDYFDIVINGSFVTPANSSFGISRVTSTPSMLNYIRENTASFNGVADSIDKQTEEIKKQTEETKKNTEETKKQTETIKDSDTTGASDSANSFFNGFESDDFGLSDIVTMPLSFIKKLSSSTCNNLSFPVPFVNQNVELPCMSSVYKTYFSSFLALYQVITTGLIAYWCCVNIFRLVQGFKDPDKDEIEVLDL